MTTTSDRLVLKFVDCAVSAKYLFLDIDGTLVDSTLRDQATADFSTREKLLDTIEDPVKQLIITRINAEYTNSTKIVLLTGRTRSLKTTRQVRSILQQPFRYLRNSRIYNPTLSSTLLKSQFFKSLLLLSQSTASVESQEALIFEDRADVIQAIQQEFEKLSHDYVLEIVDHVFILRFKF